MALSLFTSDPIFGPLEAAFYRGFDRALDSQDHVKPAATSRALHINCDIIERPDHYAIMADAPGMTAEDINVELHENTLVVSGEKAKQSEQRGKGDKVWRQERSFQKFSRSFTLPDNAQPDGIKARLEHGVLAVEVGAQTLGLRHTLSTLNGCSHC